MKSLSKYPIEAMFWVCGLAALAFLDTSYDHISICPFRYFGFDFCPGCGLGRSISYFFHGEILASLRKHPLGIVAVFILSFRIIELLKQHLKTHGKSY